MVVHDLDSCILSTFICPHSLYGRLHSLYMFSYIRYGDGLWFVVKLNDSLEPVQFELFSKQIGGGAKVNIFQYSMILFSHDKIKGLF